MYSTSHLIQYPQAPVPWVFLPSVGIGQLDLAVPLWYNLFFHYLIQCIWQLYDLTVCIGWIPRAEMKVIHDYLPESTLCSLPALNGGGIGKFWIIRRFRDILEGKSLETSIQLSHSICQTLGFFSNSNSSLGTTHVSWLSIELSLKSSHLKPWVWFSFFCLATARDEGSWEVLKDSLALMFLWCWLWSLFCYLSAGIKVI